MSTDLYLYTDSNIREQLRAAPYRLGCYTLKFYAENGRPVNKVTPTVEEFYLYPSGGALRDSKFNIISYEARFDTYRGFKLPSEEC